MHWLGVVQARRTSSNLLEPHHCRDGQVCRVLSHEFGVIRLYRRVLMHLFRVVQARRTYSKLLEPHHCRDSKVCRVLSHEFGVVRLYRTFSNYIFTREARSAGCLCTRSGWFKHVEPPRTFSNHIIAEMARCVEFIHMRSGWFGSPELSLTTSLYGKQGVQGAFALGRRSSTTSNLLEPSRTTS